ncbi:DUF3562 domain-containing protein [Cupriavidus sp. 2TAF22]|uniref:DUF3562 domain-containing protein n=1 Tax=unclassified Cupriavidus TaxID=2640874 RepID=UPI003F9302E1
MHHSVEAAPTDPSVSAPGPGDGRPARPSSVVEAIDRIARCHNVPREVIQWEFWSAWDALSTDAKFPDYVLLLAEKRVKEALRRRGQRVTGA